MENLRVKLSEKAQKTAVYLLSAWDQGIIDSTFELIEVTAGAAVRREFIAGFGVERAEEFQVPPYSDLRELQVTGLIDLQSRDDRFEVVLLPDLKRAVKNGFFLPSVEARPYQIFISYSSKDSDLMRPVKDYLLGVYAVWADDKLTGGDNWESEILIKIRDCDLFLFFVSSYSLHSHFCRAELAEALRLQKTIIPILLDDKLKLPTIIKSKQFVPMFNQLDATSMSKLYNAIIKQLHLLPQEVKDPLWPNSTPFYPGGLMVFVDAKKSPKSDISELSTGVLVFPQDVLVIEAKGVIEVDPQGTSMDADGLVQGTENEFHEYADAYETVRKDGRILRRAGSLLGWISYGSTKELSFVGKQFRETIEVEGFLHLAINDRKTEYGDNTGEFTVTIDFDEGS
jgi:hypothetical protein